MVLSVACWGGTTKVIRQDLECPLSVLWSFYLGIVSSCVDKGVSRWVYSMN